jgi:hypothetical protein
MNPRNANMIVILSGHALQYNKVEIKRHSIKSAQLRNKIRVSISKGELSFESYVIIFKGLTMLSIGIPPRTYEYGESIILCDVMEICDKTEQLKPRTKINK